MSEGVFMRRGGVILPVDPNAEEMLLALKDGGQFMGEFKAARNVRQFRLWWALMQKLSENNAIFESKEHASNQIKLGIGHFERSFNVYTGELTEEPLSIRWQSLPQAEFGELFQRAIDLICREFLPGVESDALRQEIEDMIDGPERASLGRRVHRGEQGNERME